MFFLLTTMYALCYNALDFVFTIPSMEKEGDAHNMGGMTFAMLLYSYRTSLGDWKVNTYNFLELQMCKIAWFLWLS